MKNAVSISAVIPVYNEKEYIPVTFDRIYHYFFDRFSDFEVIFVDDGSTDGSMELLKEQAGARPEVKILSTKKHCGIGGALQTGFAAAGKEMIFYIDCDLPFNLDFVEQAIPYLTHYDMVIGKRDRWDRWFQRLGSKCYDKSIEWAFGVPLSNINVGIKMFKRNILDDLNIRSVGWFFDTEFVVEAHYKGFKIKSVPLQYQKRLYGISKFSGIRSVAATGSEFIAYYGRLRKARGHKRKGEC